MRGIPFRSSIAASLVLAWALSSVPAAWAQHENDGSSAESVLLLTNGQLLSGRVSQIGAGYRIEMENGATLVIGSDEVELHCQDGNQAYRHVRQNSDTLELGQQISIARWCVRNELFLQAEKQLIQLRKLGASRRVLEMLQAEMDSRLEQSFGNAGASKSVQQASVSREKGDAGPPKKISIRELEAFIDQQPDSVYGTFVTELQSPLIYGCTAAGCHNRDARALPIVFDAKGQPVPTRMSQWNFYEVMKWVDREKPMASRLLDRAVTAHGGKASAPWDPDSKLVQTLVAWLYRASDQRGRSSSANAANEENPPPGGGNRLLPGSTDQPGIGVANPLPGQSVPSDQNDEPRGAGGDLGAPAGAFQRSSAPDSQQLRDLTVPPSPVNPLEKETKPVDPFDPDIFNERLRDFEIEPTRGEGAEKRGGPKSTDPVGSFPADSEPTKSSRSSQPSSPSKSEGATIKDFPK